MTAPRKNLLTTHRAIVATICNPQMSRGDAAVFTRLADHADDNGIAWPGMTTLADKCGLTRGAVVDCIARLTARGYIEILERGGPGRSNRYRVHLRVQGGGVDADRLRSTSGAQSANQGVVECNPLAEPSPDLSGVQPAALVDCTPHEPTHEPEHEAKVHEVGSTASTAAVGTAPALAAGLPSAASAGLQYQSFWADYPKRQHVARAEARLSELQAEGVLLAEIEAGARAYAKWVRAKHLEGQYIAHPLNWLNDRRWLDDWSLPKHPQRDAAAKPGAPARTADRAEAASKDDGKAQGATEGRKGARKPEERSAQAASTDACAAAPDGEEAEWERRHEEIDRILEEEKAAGRAAWERVIETLGPEALTEMLHTAIASKLIQKAAESGLTDMPAHRELERDARAFADALDGPDADRSAPDRRPYMFAFDTWFTYRDGDDGPVRGDIWAEVAPAVATDIREWLARRREMREAALEAHGEVQAALGGAQSDADLARLGRRASAEHIDWCRGTYNPIDQLRCALAGANERTEGYVCAFEGNGVPEKWSRVAKALADEQANKPGPAVVVSAQSAPPPWAKPPGAASAAPAATGSAA